MTSLAAKGSFILPIVLVALFAYAFAESAHLRQSLAERPYLWVAAIASVLALFGTRTALRESPFLALLCSSSSIALALVFFLAGLYPDCVVCPLQPANSLDIQNAASSPLTLQVMAWMALLMLPLILIYTVWVYRVFKGPSKPTHPY
jgi:cytochrome d ubiquinol oxidase subunit II